MEPRMGLTITRRFLFLSLAAAPAASWAACAPPRVLFVCPAGTVKSAIARELLRARVSAERLDVAVASRGLQPEDHVSPTLATKLRADGLEPWREAALRLTDRDVANADIVIAFDDAANAPALRGARAWRTPSWNADYDGAKADLAVRMDRLVAELRGRAEGCR
jgi:protein-tyrosine-phosphatase